MKWNGHYEYKGYKWKEADNVGTRIRNQIDSILCVRGLQMKWVGHGEYERSYKWNGSDITSTRVTSENYLEIVSTRIANQINRILSCTGVTSEKNWTLWVRDLQVRRIGHCEDDGYKWNDMDIMSTRVTSEKSRTLWVRGSEIKLIAYCVYEGYKWNEAEIASTRVIKEMNRT